MTTQCVRPGVVSAEELLAYGDGMVLPHVAEHLRLCPACAARAGEYANFQRRLVNRLFRLECPSSQTLTDYQARLLPPERHTSVAAHVLACPRCADELRTLRQFLASSFVPSSTRPDTWLERLVARLLPSAVAIAAVGVRGEHDLSVQTYRAGGLTFTVRFLAEAGHQAGSLTGLIWRETADAPPPAGSIVRLIAQTGAIRATEISDLGDFVLTGVEPGDYHLEIELSDSLVVVEDLRLAD